MADSSEAPSRRLTSLDAYRGLVMMLMMGEVLHFGKVAEALPDSGFWRFLEFHQSHVPWVGCSLHDLIQPSFSFLVGAALPFSMAARASRNEPWKQSFLHAVVRSLILIFLGIFLRSIGKPITNFTFEDTLTQIGLGYTFLFLLGGQSLRNIWISIAFVLAGYWAAFALYPLPPPGFDGGALGVPADWPHNLSGLAAHWNKNTNLAMAFDGWFMNLFPRTKPFVFNGGGYVTLSFIPTLGTMLLGLVAGRVLQSERPAPEKLRWLACAGAVSLLAGWLLGALGICPVVKRIWTPSWVLFSAGWCFWFTAAFYWLADVKEKRTVLFPLVVVGMNSIAAYVVSHIMDEFIKEQLLTNLRHETFQVFGVVYEPFVLGVTRLTVLWLFLWWMWRRKLFLKI